MTLLRISAATSRLPPLITNAEHRITKRGDAFGSLIIEDYQEAFKLNLFNESYLKFKHFMEPGTFVAIKGRIVSS